MCDATSSNVSLFWRDIFDASRLPGHVVHPVRSKYDALLEQIVFVIVDASFLLICTGWVTAIAM